MKRFNWGTGILLFFIFYISILVLFVIKSRNVDHSLVMKDYYAYDLAYDDVYHKIRNCQIYNQDVEIRQLDNEPLLELDFGANTERITGTVQMYRPSMAELDVVIPFSLVEDNRLQLKKDKLTEGHWIIKVDWQIGRIEFYKELPINIKTVS